MTDGPKDGKELRKALQLAVCKIIFDEDRKLGTRTTQSAIAALAELTYQYATKSLIPDLYTFSTHANRKSTISPDDVAVVLRKIQPDQLEAFKRQFCRGGTKASKNTVANENDESGGKVGTGGRRRKRGETEVLSWSSSSSSSSDDNECVNDSIVDRKRKINPGRSSNFSRPTKPMIATGGRSAQMECLLNKFQLRSEATASTGKKSALNYDTFSSDDDDSTTSASKGLGITKTVRSKETVVATTTAKSRISQKLSLQSVPFRKKDQSNPNFRSKNGTFSDDDDDNSTDDEDLFLERNTNGTREKGSLGTSDYPVANLPDRAKLKRSTDQNSDVDDKHFDSGNARLDHEQKSGNGGDGISHGTPKQSQVAEALANLSSDSGMDYSEEETEIRLDAAKFSTNHRHHPRIESDSDD